MSDRIVIAARFCGPPESSNGGYASGVLAGFVDAPAVEVTLRLPPPLERELVVEHEEGRVLLLDHELLVAEAAPVELQVEPPLRPSIGEVEAAASAFTGFESHQFPGCFSCGPTRAAGDGLRIFPGPLAGAEGLVAALWTPEPELADASGDTPPPLVWAALDCPGYWAHASQAAAAARHARRGPMTALLGRMAAQQLAPVRAGERQVVLGWATGSEGRRLFAESALLTESGDLTAVARSTWIRIEEPD